ncbi:STAS domain-containing protein [Desulfotomaculum copahuensis]|uniref:STAS domain-containing protein n=1 Tax=Desulfotomaculum copahuensis TaxID=1838280 RepID=UPI001373498E|nr:STAS domain-containing protein [Desulfotomaculum copahuensis]
MGRQFTCRVEKTGPVRFLRLDGEITGESEASFKNMPVGGAADGALVLDFAGVDYINSAGLALLIGLIRRCRQENRSVGAINLSDHYRKIFHMVGLNDYIALFESDKQARMAFSPH